MKRFRGWVAAATTASTLLLMLGGTTAASAGTARCHDGPLSWPATIVGTSGDDSLVGTNGRDVIAGLGGNDVVRGLGGDDVICGGPGNDVLNGGPGGDGLLGGGGNDVLRGGPGSDGGLSGDLGNDKLYGERDGYNDLYPGPGNDLIVGSDTGPDWMHLETATRPIHASLLTGISKGQGTDRMVNVDALYGGPYDDTLSGSNRADGLVGRGGFDTSENYDQNRADARIFGPMNVNLRTGMQAGDGNDTIEGIEAATGSDGNDTMIGNDKDNAFYWLFAGNDTVDGGGGNDYVDGGAGADVLTGGDGNDILVMLDGKVIGPTRQSGVTVDLSTNTDSDGDTLGGFENVFGTFHDDTLIGDDGPNSLEGFDGNDTVSGGGGNDLVDPGNGSDVADGGTGMDPLGNLDHYSGGMRIDLSGSTDSDHDTLAGFEDVLGTFEHDTLVGDGGPNVMFGSFGNDVLRGRGGDDTLVGDDGVDKAHGGPGTDRCQAEVQDSCEFWLGSASVSVAALGWARAMHGWRAHLPRRWHRSTYCSRATSAAQSILFERK